MRLDKTVMSDNDRFRVLRASSRRRPCGTEFSSLIVHADDRQAPHCDATRLARSDGRHATLTPCVIMLLTLLLDSSSVDIVV